MIKTGSHSMKQDNVRTIWSISTSLLVALPFFAVSLVAIASPQSISGCGDEEISSGVYTLMHDGIERVYRVHVPAGYETDVAAPVVAFFHGWGGNEDEFAANKVITDEADQHGYILVAPRGIGSGDPDNKASSWTFSGSATGLDGDQVNAAVAGDTDAICDHDMTPDYSYGSCASSKSNTCSWTHCQADDVGFAVTLVNQVKAKLCVDTNRVFAMGGSNGGMYIWELGQNPVSAPHFKALAALIGLPHRGYLNSQAKDADMPVIVVTGMQDNVVPPGKWDDPAFTTTSNGNDRFFYTGATAITRSWAAQHACDTTGKALEYDDGYEEADCRSYCSDDPGWPRVLDCRAQMGHAYRYEWSWKLILDFFNAHSK
jgi:poly(3-hydroxybutyrate) depolymerase